jgi:hypothetical protein
VARRRPDVKNAAVELGFIVAALACGLFDAPIWAAGAVAFASLAYWSWTRRVALNKLRGANWAIQCAISVAMIFALLGGAYWLGLFIGGHT